MTLEVLRDDALRTTADGFDLLVNLPWIRSLPIASLRDVRVQVDGAALDVDVRAVGEWWHPEDRVAVHLAAVPIAGPPVVDVKVDVAFTLAIPYLAVGPGGPLLLPFRASRTLTPTSDSAPRTPIAAATVSPRATAPQAALPAGWTLTASAFNGTPEVVRGERTAREVAVGLVADGVADTIEIEAGQVWRTFPAPTDADVDELRTALDAIGGRVSIVGASIDDWTPDDRRRTDAERLAFLTPQLRAAARAGAIGARVPLGQAGPDLLRMLQPTLLDLDLVLFEEAQGHETPRAAASAYDDVAALDDPHIRVLLDISMLMPALPVTYLDRLRGAGVPRDLMHRLETAWRDPETHAAVIDLLRSGGVPGRVHTLYMNLLVRFGRSDAADLRDVLPLVGGVHLKFWDLDDADGRVSRPIRDIGHELAAAGFTGTLCSEWGGHEWLDDDPTAMTRAHLALARQLLAIPR